MVPPVIWATPRTLRSGWLLSRYPTHTEVASLGVYPTNQAFRKSWAVPVFPAVSGCPMFAAVPVPRTITWCRICVSCSATPGGSACNPRTSSG